MGLCRCQRITDLYCFVCKVSVCEQCLVSEHEACVIGTYVQWIQNSEWQPPNCPVCRDLVTAGHALRLPCLHLLHPECLEVYGSRLPPDTALAGYCCPQCSKPFVPAPGSTVGPVSRKLAAVLVDASWLPASLRPSAALLAEEQASTSPHLTQPPTIDLVAAQSSRNADSRLRTVRTQPSTLTPVASSGVASKSARATLQQLGLVEPSELPLFSTPTGTTRVGSARRRGPRQLFLFLSAFCFFLMFLYYVGRPAIVWLIGDSLTPGDTPAKLTE